MIRRDSTSSVEFNYSLKVQCHINPLKKQIDFIMVLIFVSDANIIFPESSATLDPLNLLGQRVRVV